MSNYIFNNQVSANPINPNVGSNNSWIQVDSNAGRPLFAQASYITNFDGLIVSLTAGNVDIGAVHIQDPDSGLKVNVADIGTGLGALRVLSQDLESDLDDISIGDKDGKNFASIHAPTSSLNVNITNFSILTAKQQEQITLANSITSNGASANTLLNSVTANQATQITLEKTLSANSVFGTLTSKPLYISTTDANPINVTYADNAHCDAFGRLRVSQPTTLFDTKLLHSKNQLFFSQVVSSGNIFYNNDDASMTIATSGIGYAIRQTTQRFNYQPGKSQLAMFTGVLSADNISTKRYGLFNSLTAAPYSPDVGLYFQASNNQMSVWIQNGGNLVPSQSATQVNWNIDTFSLSGINPSGKVLDFTKAQIFVIEYEWLGVGRVRFGFDVDGRTYWAHQFTNANKFNGVYMRTPNLPIRAEVVQTGSGFAAMKQICATVMSEGGADFTGVTRAVDTGNSSLSAIGSVAVGVRFPMLGLRLQWNKLDSVNEVLNAAVLSLPVGTGTNTTASALKYELVLNPTVSNGGTWTSISDSNFDYWVGTGSETITSGTLIASGFVMSGSIIDLSGFRFEKFMRLGCSINGNRDRLYLVVTPLQATGGLFGSLSFIESD